MMKSIYGKLICGFLITIVFSFSVAGYVALRSNYDQIEDMAKNELSATNEYVTEILNILEDANISNTMNQYAISSKVNITLFSPEYGYYQYGESQILPSKETMQKYYYDKHKDNYYHQENSIQSYGKKVNIKDKDVYMYVQKDTSYEKSIFANSAVLILGCVFLSGNLVFIAIADIIVKPITRLTNATKELSKGNYNVRVNYVGDDEISKLNQGFNQMAQQLAKQEETRQKFISDISHEFQTPLTAIQGFANILKDEDLPKSQRQKYADIILFHSKRLSTLSKNMLQLTLLEREEVELKYTTFSIVEQLSRVISTQENQAILKDIEIVFEKPRKDILVNGDEQRLEQVWINIISNAIKYTDNGGLIIIKVKKTSKEVEVSIEDTGRGMSKEVISHIFERFYREDKARSIEGNGLGLSIVKSIIDLHHGNIDVISQVDVGSTFIIKLPNERKTFDLKEKLSLNRKD
ncbi:MAG: HAMP domain-containing histidine kinase [[Clostridium] spiroforme]|uniref:histidine kinase n=1 Tax=Thomasclavelia spiroformis TaxID=29348 RepID=A0A943EJV5_9FIRM|nr:MULTISPECIES: HAMP domain-containing sensor histidine kinase [Thomasclavelia]MBS5587761.1 HAMP domain-containing histidine kinase [Thomasclavelia spiroformis]